MKVFIVGKLGEVIKKVFELEDAIQEYPGNTILLSELAAYQEILQMWPVLDSVTLHIAIGIFKHNCSILKDKENLLRQDMACSTNNMMDVGSYLAALDNVRSSLTVLNDLGLHIGPSPWMELDDAKME